MWMKDEPKEIRDTREYQDVRQRGKLKWQKDRNKMSHLTPKKKKRKK